MKRLMMLISALIISLNSFADTASIGVVDLQKLMKTTPQIQAIQKKLENKFKSRRDNLMKMEASIKKDMSKLKRDDAVMTDPQKKQLQEKIMNARQKFSQEGQQYQQELSAAHNKEMEGFYSQLREIITKVAKNNKYDVILQKDAAPYVNDKLDVTDKVVAALKK